VLGVLDVRSDYVGAFSQDDRFLFETLADNIAVALRNAALYRSESWRRQVADSLQQVAGLLSAETDLEHVLNAILLELERTLPLDLAAIWLLDEVSLQDEVESPTLYLAAVRGSEVDELDLELGLRPEDVLAFNPPPGEILDAYTAGTWLLEALSSSNPIARSTRSLFEPLGACLDYPGDYSAIGAPLRAGEHPLGVLVLAHHTPGRYGSEASAMTAGFASYAAVAIENARLYEAAHDQAWVSTVLLQVAAATQSQTSLEELLETVISITPTLGGVRSCLLYLLDEAGGFMPAAASGLSPEQQDAFECQRFVPGDVPALDRLLEHGAPQVLYGQDDEQPLIELIYEDGVPPGPAFPVLVPLLARGEVLGTFMVDYSLGIGSGTGGALEAFFDERLAIIQGIAQQTAMAVENVRLFKAQREEAYISVALLQAAQAVASGGGLDEILGSIVRITPILVGVERSAIYLWDPSQELFQLSQAYGIPREVQAPTYNPETFPFLYAVMQHDQMMAYPVAALSSEVEDQIPDWSRASVLSLDEASVYLETDIRLLLAFPLSVKGDVLGVLLVEEPETSEEPAPAGVYLRPREKRMEIITGISQQAALAIQNDLLRREMFERERLAREMQLAREIQQAFMPDELPNVPGWDIQMRWRTAREVGGDFYDFFKLSEGRLGLVIADVADKGMPAALFMTLVRTLVRATVQYLDAPNEVLQRVNEIIVPDAPQGMFVTLAYAVLDLESGTLDYANAGHNPPMVMRSQEHCLERLGRSGMALGVLPDSSIESRQVTLEPGDFLVFYTDGVTEAFSPDGDIYGEERLCRTIEAAACWSHAEADPGQVTSQEILEAIDDSVSEFVGEAPLPDDLTLVVLKRSNPELK
jgi:serine phosphatase RsbU (regulator of sigma subunit)